VRCDKNNLTGETASAALQSGAGWFGKITTSGRAQRNTQAAKMVSHDEHRESHPPEPHLSHTAEQGIDRGIRSRADVGPIAGTETPVPMIRRLAAARVDAILVSLGALQYSTRAFLVPDAPAIIARLDWTNVWCRKDAAKTGKYASCLVGQVEDAVRYGADAVVTYMFMGSGDAEHEAREIAKNAEVSRAAERFGVPHIIESMARGKDVANPYDVSWVKLHTRIASELGADLIKTDYPGDADGLREVVEACPTPVLVAGGPKTGGDEQALAMVSAVAKAGAAGVIFGRTSSRPKIWKGFWRERASA
jgi:class I fructose-bisphosphate aldolase